jgi:hypothetical protein
MNLRALANAATQLINPNIPVVVKLPVGITIDPLTRRQVPGYADVSVLGQVQALDGDDLKHMAGLNIQGTLRAVYLYGNVGGVIRPDQQPSARLVFTTNESGVTKAREWSVFKVLEAWPDWCKVAVVYQNEAPQ